MGVSKLQICIFALSVLSHLVFEVSAADNISYVGAVVEYYPVRNGVDGIITNAENFVTIISQASNYSADIIVFPESALTTGLRYSSTNRSSYPSFSSFIPDPAAEHTPCNNSSTIVLEALQLISCAARNYSMYVLVNLHEKENCTTTGTTERPCPRDGYFFYNTNVVFNRSGTIVSRYRKFNLFGEAGFNVTATPDVSYFRTDFNVTFGHFICFDILFNTPTLTLVNDHGITDILFSAHWFSELPYLTAVQAQSGWAYANNVNLLASGFNNPATGSGGSGIYTGTDGPLATVWSEAANNILAVARIPKVINGSRTYISDSSYPITYTFDNTELTTLINITTVAQQALILDDLTPYTTGVLALTNGTTTTSQQLCDRNLCCTFNVTRTFDESSVNASDEYYRYRLAVFNGVRDHSGVATTGVQICSIIFCRNDTLSSCGLRFAADVAVVRPTVFNNILIAGNFSTNSTAMQMPNSLTSNILPLNVSDFTYTRIESTDAYAAEIQYGSTIDIDDLLTFAIYGRNFSADSLEATTANTGDGSSSALIALARFPAVITVFIAVAVTLLIDLRN